MVMSETTTLHVRMPSTLVCPIATMYSNRSTPYYARESPTAHIARGPNQGTHHAPTSPVPLRKKLKPAICLHYPYECVTECAQRTNFLVVSADTTVRIQKIRKFVLSTNFF